MSIFGAAMTINFETGPLLFSRTYPRPQRWKNNPLAFYHFLKSQSRLWCLCHAPIIISVIKVGFMTYPHFYELDKELIKIIPRVDRIRYAAPARVPPVVYSCTIILQLSMNYPAASNGVSIGIFLSPQGAGNSPLVRRRRIKTRRYWRVNDESEHLNRPTLEPRNFGTLNPL